MKKALFTLLIAILIIGCINPTPQTTQKKSEIATLKLNTNGHTSIINDVIITKDKEIITASDDKSIRVWDSRTGEEKQKILGEIGKGKIGMIYAIALSSNEQFLAVGVNMGEKRGVIRIYNYQTGTLERVIEAHNAVVLDLAFSADGKYLISGAKDNLAKIWSVNDKFGLIDTIKFHTNFVYGVKIIKKGDDYYAITASDDGQIALYSMRDRELIKSDKKANSLNFLATNQQHIAVCGFEGGKIWIYDFNLKPVKTIDSKTQPNGLAYSPNGELLIAGVGEEPNLVTLYNSKNYTPKSSFKQHENAVLAVGFLDNKTAISAGGKDNEVYLWNIENAEVKLKIEGIGSKVWSVGVNGDEIAWGSSWRKNYGKSPLQKSLNLKTIKKSGIRGAVNGMMGISTTKDGMELIHKEGGEYGYENAILVLKKEGKEIEIKRNSLSGYKHNCYGFYKNYIVSGGANGVLQIFNFDGKEVANLLGHTGEVWGLALDGERLVSGGSDQTIRVWDLKQVEKQGVAEIEPQLNIFVSKNSDWVIWTPQGFFDSSKGGAKYIGYHINKGSDQEAKFVSVDRLYNLFYRPDLIQKALDGKDLTPYLKRNIEQVLIEGGLAPTIKIVSKHSKKSTKQNIDIEIKVCDNGGGVENLKVYRNGTAIKRIDKKTKAFRHQQLARDGCLRIMQNVVLVNGTNKISIQATNAKDSVDSNRESIVIDYNTKKSIKSNLHILTLSINNYEDKSLTLSYANNDSDAITKKLKKIGKKVFSEVYSYQIKDENVTMLNILKEFKTISQKITSEDTFILFLSGHGTMEGGVYHFIPFDCHNSDSVTKKAVSQKSLLDALADIPAYKSVVLLDTCQSGGFEEGLASTVIEKFGTRSGRAILSASTKTQNAIEGYENHGVFTHTLLEAMSNPKVYNHEDKLSVNGVAYFVKKELPKKTMKKWKYLQNAKFFKDNSDVEIILGGK